MILKKCQTQKSHIFLQTLHKKFKLTYVEWPSPTVNVKCFWVSILMTSWKKPAKSCKKVNQKVNGFARIACSLKFDQRKLLLNGFITSQFSYAPVVWVFHNRKLNNHRNRIHGRALRIVYQDHNLTFDELLAKDCFFKIHNCNFRKLLIEIFKVKMKLLTWMTFLTLYNTHIILEMNWDLSHEKFVL